MSKQTILANVANEAVDQLQCSREYLRWLSALGRAIHDDLTTGRGFIAKDLAGLVQYLADDHWNAVDCHISQASERLETLEIRA